MKSELDSDMMAAFEEMRKYFELVGVKPIDIETDTWRDFTLRARDALREYAVRGKEIAIVGGCPCGIAYVSGVDSLDSGTTLRCEEGHAIIVDVSSPEDRKALYERISRKSED